MTANALNDSSMSDEIEESIIETLTKVLAEGEDNERSLAVRALSKLSGAGVVSLLIRSLHDPDPDVRNDAANALAEVGDPMAILPLISNLRDDPVGELKPAYIRALLTLSGREALPLLISLTTGRAEQEGILWDDEVSDWDDWFDVQYIAIEALGLLGDGEQGEVDAILQALNDPDGQDVSAQATKALSRLGARGCNALGRVAQNAPDLLRKRIANALTEANVIDAASLLTTLATDESPSVRIAAIGSARKLELKPIQKMGLKDPSPEVRAYTVSLLSGTETKALAVALHDLAPEVRISACATIERANIPQPKLDIVKQTTDSLRKAPPEELASMVAASAVADPVAAARLLEDIVNHSVTARPVRRAALRALGKLGTKSSVDLLMSAAGDEHRDVRLEAIASLGRIAGSDSSEKQRGLSALSNILEGALIAPPENFEPASDNVFQLPPKRGAEAAGEEKGKRIKLDREGNVLEPDVQPPESLEDETPEEAPEALTTSTLASILATPVGRPPSGAEDLTDDDLDMLEMATSKMGKRRLRLDESPPPHIDVRRFAANVAGAACHTSLIPALTVAVGDADQDLSLAAMESLREIVASGCAITAAVETLLVMANASNQALRRSAILTLGEIRCESAHAAVSKALRDPVGAVRAAACKACLGDFLLIEEARDLLHDPDPLVRCAAAHLVAFVPHSETIDDLLDFAVMENGEHRMEASKILAGFGSPAIKKLLRFIADPDLRKRLIALEMLPDCLQYEYTGA